MPPCPAGCDESCDDPLKATCVENDGPPLPCIGASTHDRLDAILQMIDERLCQGVGADPFDTYNLFCLAPVASQKVFAEKLAAQFCNLAANFSNFTGSVFPEAVTGLNGQISNLNKSGFTSACEQVGILPADTLAASLSKLDQAICDLHQQSLNITAVNWGMCSTITVSPATIAEGFEFVLTQICSLMEGGGIGAVLPVFDNTGSCLSSPTVEDSLFDTIVKMRARLCSTPTFSVAGLTPGCTDLTGATTLEQTLDRMLVQIDMLSKNTIRQSDENFTIEAADPMQPCGGKKLVFTGASSSSDRLVAVNAADADPGTLEEKLIGGGGIQISATLTPGKLTILPAAQEDELVKVSPTDPTAGYLVDKLVGKPADIGISVNPVVGDRLEVSASVDYAALIDRLFDLMETDPDVKSRFCTLVRSCPSPCQPPTNVQAIPVT